MNTYYLRCIESDIPQLIALGHALGALQTQDEVVTATDGGYWDVLGALPDFTDSETLRKDAEGNTYWHANLRTPVDLRERAEALALANPEIAGALSQISRFFVVDAEGKAVSPAYPSRVFL